MKTRIKALILTATAALAACGGPQTPQQMLLGEWEAEDYTLTRQGQTLTMRDAELEFDADGTFESEVVMDMGGAVFGIETEGTYTFDGTTLTETLGSTQVTVIEGGETAQALVRLIEGGVAAMHAQPSTVTLSEDALVLDNPGVGNPVRYSRD